MPRRSDYGKPRSAYRPVAERLSDYSALFAQGMSNADIARQFGITGEAVRQIRKKYFPQLPARRMERKAQIRKRNAAQQFRRPGLFRTMIRRWLAAAGYFQCGHCRLVKCIATDRTKGTPRRCKSCTAKNTRRYYRNGGKEKLLAWQRANPNKVRKAQERYAAKRSNIR